MGKHKKPSSKRFGKGGSAKKHNQRESSSQKSGLHKKTVQQHDVSKNDDRYATVTMEALQDLSDSDESALPPEDEWGEDARALKQAIQAGHFNNLFPKKKATKDTDHDVGDDEESMEEVVLGDEEGEEENFDVGDDNQDVPIRGGEADDSNDDHDSSEAGDDENDEDDDDDDESPLTAQTMENNDSSESSTENKGESESEEEEEERDEPKPSKGKNKKQQSKPTKSLKVDVGEELEDCNSDEEDPSNEDENKSDESVDEKPLGEDDDKKKNDAEEDREVEIENERDNDGVEDKKELDREQDDGTLSIKQLNAMRQRSLRTVADDLLEKQKGLTWPETFDIVSSSSLPFGKEDEDGHTVDIHDDLKREVTFYNVALEAAVGGRRHCEDADIPFSRPDTFFAEMVKTDEHMAKIKDRLIFENKKIEAVNQRKANKEQKMRAKESHANKLAEKARRKKDNLKAVDDWARTAASQRGSGLLNSNDNFPQRSPQPNKKRMAANKRWGFGGKKGRFKQTDPKKLNDMSGFSSQGNFAGGRKRPGGPSGGAQKRPGKRAREANRSRR